MGNLQDTVHYFQGQKFSNSILTFKVIIEKIYEMNLPATCFDKNRLQLLH